MARTTINQRQAPELRQALELAYHRLNADGLTTWNEQFEEVLYQCRCSLEIEGLEEIRPIMKAAIGYDPLEKGQRPNVTERAAPERTETRESPSLQDLSRRIYTKAKAEKAKRFWGLYVHVTKIETLREAYRMA